MAAIDLAGATDTLYSRLLAKIVHAGPASPCDVWVGAYNAVGARSQRWGHNFSRRPIIRLGGKAIKTPVYVAPLLLTLAKIEPPTPDHNQAAHRCPHGSAWHGMYSCVDLSCLRWATHGENEADKHATS